MRWSLAQIERIEKCQDHLHSVGRQTGNQHSHQRNDAGSRRSPAERTELDVSERPTPAVGWVFLSSAPIMDRCAFRAAHTTVCSTATHTAYQVAKVPKVLCKFQGTCPWTLESSLAGHVSLFHRAVTMRHGTALGPDLRPPRSPRARCGVGRHHLPKLARPPTSMARHLTAYASGRCQLRGWISLKPDVG